MVEWTAFVSPIVSFRSVSVVSFDSDSVFCQLCCNVVWYERAVPTDWSLSYSPCVRIPQWTVLHDVLLKLI